MSSNVDYTICPECSSLNAAMWHPQGRRSYSVSCTVCGHEFEHGHYHSHVARLRDRPINGDGQLALSNEEIRQLFTDEFVQVYGNDEDEDYRDIPY